MRPGMIIFDQVTLGDQVLTIIIIIIDHNQNQDCYQCNIGQAKRRSGSFAAGGQADVVEEEGEEVLKDNIMTDIKEGFIQRRLPDGGFKVQLSFIFFSLDVQNKQSSPKIRKDDDHPI